MRIHKLIAIILLAISPVLVKSQIISIDSYTIDNNGQVLLEVESTINDYFILNVRHSADSEDWYPTSVTLGKEDKTIISESLKAYPIDQYQVIKHDISIPIDTDMDEVDDITEWQDMPTQGPLNHAKPVELVNGSITVNSLTTFKELSVEGVVVPWSPFLNDKQFVKFAIINLDTDTPELYFINTVTHDLHRSFMETVNPDWLEDDSLIKGEITYNPTVVSNNGTLGDFSFNYSVGAGMPFATVQKCQRYMLI